LLSSVFLTIRPFPRFVRVSLLFTGVYLLMAISAVLTAREVQEFRWDWGTALLAGLAVNVVVALLSCINHVNRRPLEKAKTTSEFIAKS